MSGGTSIRLPPPRPISAAPQDRRNRITSGSLTLPAAKTDGAPNAWARARLGLSHAALRWRSWFPDREFFMRSNGQVRFIRVSGRLQMRLAGGLAALVLLWLGSLAVLLISHVFAMGDRAGLQEREAALASAESRVARYHQGLGAVAQDIQRRQDMIETLVKDQLGQLPAAPEAQSAAASRKISLEMPEADGLAKIEARQLAFVEALTRLVDARAARAETAIRRVGLNPAQVAPLRRRADQRAMGGPLIRLFSGRELDGREADLDPRFARLGTSMARMTALEQGLARLPHALPASADYISSGFGVRADPFTGGGAFHPGLDFKGPLGAPIFAAAQGVVQFAGVRSGYGNCVEVDHGQGLVTRYAHMSRIEARPGQRVGPGVEIGRIGSTGRSTGPHLHFEVRIADRPVDPRPFLETLPHVLEKADHAGA